MKKGKLDYHHGDLKTSLLKAALEVMKNQGFEGLSLRKIAKVAGVSPGAPYRHYKDLESLYADLACSGFERLATYLKQTRKQFKRNALIQFREAGVAYVQFALEDPDIFQIMYGNCIIDHSKYPALMIAEEKGFEILCAILTDCQTINRVRKGNVIKMATSAWAMVHGIANLLLGNQVMFRNLGARQAKELTKQMMENLYLGLQ